MNYKNLGNTDLKVSTICLGTMTWGEQNNQNEAFEQMDYALDQGVNFWDTAELYAVPPRKETYGDTEEIIGNWFEKTKKRDKVILATKVAGPARDYLRNGENSFVGPNLESALNNSLKRLKTEYVDLYQLHWPERKVNNFGRLGYVHQENDWNHFEDVLGELHKYIDQGKIRHIGLSNETPWGAMGFLKVSEDKNLPRMMSVQNPYSLLNRSYEVGLAEISIREKCGLLAYSPLAFGMLTGKYDDGRKPEKARLTLYANMYTRYTKEKGIKYSEKLNELARESGLTPTQMALGFVNSRSFVTSNIVGATNLDQLNENIKTFNLELSEDLLEKIDEIHDECPFPCP